MQTPDSIIVGSLLAAVILVGLIWHGRPDPRWFIYGEGRYELKNSWISNTTVFAAILGTPLKDIAAISTATLASLNVLFLAVAGVAVLLQAGWVRTLGKNHCIPVWGLLLAGILALWAVIGQLATLWYVVCEAANPFREPRPILTELGGRVLSGVVLVAVVLVLIFAWRMMRALLDTAQKECAPPATAAKEEAKTHTWAAL